MVRSMEDKIRLALKRNDTMTQDALYEYIKENIDSDITMITFYLTLRRMIRGGIVVESAGKYRYTGV